MGTKSAEEKYIKGHLLECPICKNKYFTERRTLMNTAGASFLGFDWANKEAQNYICSDCGYVMWFMD